MRRSDGKWFFTRVKRTIYRYAMINSGDKIAVGVSGGKDSAALLYILLNFQRHSPLNFALLPVYVDLGLQKSEETKWAEQFAQSFKLPLHLEKTQIYQIVFETRQEANPCALCANMRHGALNQAALKLGCNKVALGHHLDDAIETFMINLIYTGRMDTFKPVTYLDRAGLHLIRPLIQLPESVLSSLAKREKLPLFKNLCPVSGKTKRQETEDLLNELSARYPDLRRKWRSALITSPFWQQDDHL